MLTFINLISHILQLIIGASRVNIGNVQLFFFSDFKPTREIMLFFKQNKHNFIGSVSSADSGIDENYQYNQFQSDLARDRNHFLGM